MNGQFRFSTFGDAEDVNGLLEQLAPIRSTTKMSVYGGVIDWIPGQARYDV